MLTEVPNQLQNTYPLLKHPPFLQWTITNSIAQTAKEKKTQLTATPQTRDYPRVVFIQNPTNTCRSFSLAAPRKHNKLQYNVRSRCQTSPAGTCKGAEKDNALKMGIRRKKWVSSCFITLWLLQHHQEEQSELHLTPSEEAEVASAACSHPDVLFPSLRSGFLLSLILPRLPIICHDSFFDSLPDQGTKMDKFILKLLFIKECKWNWTSDFFFLYLIFLQMHFVMEICFLKI